MKVFTVNIRSVILGLVAICLVLCIVIIAISISVAGAQNKKVLPIYRVGVEPADKRISVTFDNAWGADDIPDILASLKKYNAKATFFVLGTWVEKYPEIVKSIFDEGHEIANHSYVHYHPAKLSDKQLTEEIVKCNEAIKSVTGKECNIYRAPYGEYNNEVVTNAQNNGMFVIQWDVDSLDWRNEMTKQAIYDRVTKKVKAGSIILFHNDTKYTREVLPEILEKLTSDGYTSVTVSNLIYKENYSIDNNGQQNKR